MSVFLSPLNPKLGSQIEKLGKTTVLSLEQGCWGGHPDLSLLLEMGGFSLQKKELEQQKAIWVENWDSWLQSMLCHFFCDLGKSIQILDAQYTKGKKSNQIK